MRNILDVLNEGLETKYFKDSGVLDEAKYAGAELVYEGDGWKIYKAGNPKEARKLGKDTKWCIPGKNGYNGPEWFDKHMASGVKEYYVLMSKDDKWLYFNYGDLEQQQRRHVFYDKKDYRYTLSNISYILDAIPVKVLRHLPFLDEVDFEKLVKTQTETRDVMINGGTLVITPGTSSRQTQSVAYELKKVIISNDVEKIIDGMFRDIGGLKEVEFERGSVLKRIGDEAFTFTNLPYIKIPRSVTYIGKSAFRKGFDLKVEFEEGSQLETIGSRAFEECTSIDEITLPATLQKINGDAFKGCSSLKKINIKGKYRPSLFASCGLDSDVEVNWVDRKSTQVVNSNSVLDEAVYGGQKWSNLSDEERQKCLDADPNLQWERG